MDEYYELKSVPVMATKRKLKAKWTLQSVGDLTAEFAYVAKFLRAVEYQDVMGFLERHGMVALCQAYDFDYLDDLASIFPSLARRLAKAS